MDRRQDSSVDSLLQRDHRDLFAGEFSRAEWVPLYQELDENGHFGAIYSAILPKSIVSDALTHPNWELTTQGAAPGCSTSWLESGERQVEYHRFCTEHGIEPLVLCRTFDGVRAPFREILEEFRLFHNLFPDPHSKALQRIDASGNLHDVIRFGKTGSVYGLRRAIRQFLALREACLAIFVDSTRYSKCEIDEIPEAERQDLSRGKSHCLEFRAGRTDALRPLVDELGVSYSHLMGKAIVWPLPVEESGFWPYRHTDEEYPQFIIGIDEDGAPHKHSCDYHRLADYFGENKGAPHYLTPVFFRREVLRKYYDNPDSYEVSDGGLTCAGLWNVRIDNNLNDHVMVFLGDLGRDLPPEDRQYWLSFNVVPQGAMSRANFRRGFLAEFAAPDAPDHLLRAYLHRICDRWKKKFGWDLFLPLNEGDAHLASGLRVPLSANQADFDEQILALSKVVIDSLNEKQLNENCPQGTPARGIALLKRYLEAHDYPDSEETAGLLQKIQSLRSTGSAHRKGSKYERAIQRANPDSEPLDRLFRSILEECTQHLRQLEMHFLAGDPN